MEERRILDSWKEISAYLNRSVMTCQRWERKLDLPVHRLDGTPRARVFAYPEELDVWLAKKAGGRGKRRKPVFAYALATLAVISIAGFFGWRPWSRNEGPPVFSADRPSIAILNLGNRTGQKDLDQYRDVLASMISDDLSQSRYIYVVPSDQVNSILTRLGLLEAEAFTRESLKDIGRRGMARFIATGYYAQAGERYLVHLRIQEAESGRVLGTAGAQGDGLDSLFALADEITAQIKPLLELTAVEIANDIDSPLQRVTTSSLIAYDYYLKAARLAGATRNLEATELLEKAVAIDPEFAMAYSDLACWHSTMGNWVEWKENSDKALELSKRLDRLPLREKLLIEGMAARDAVGRIGAYSKLLELYPEDVMGNFLLGFVYNLLLDEPAKAADQYSIPISFKTEIPLPYLHLANVRCRSGDYIGAERVLKDFMRDFPGHPGNAAVKRNLAYIFMVQAKFKQALAILEEAFHLDPLLAEPISRSRGTVLALMGNFVEAEAELRSCLVETDVYRLIYINQDLARLYKARGKFRLAEESLRRALAAAEKNDLIPQAEELAGDIIENDLAAGDIDGAEIMLSEISAQFQEQGRDPRANSTWLEGKIGVLLKRRAFEEAGQYASTYAAVVEKGANRRAARYPLRLQGLVEMEKGDLGTACGLLTQAKSLLWSQVSLAARTAQTKEWHALFMESLALADLRSGALERARQEYEAITRLTTGRLAYGDIYARSFYMLGQIYEELGKKRPARANYRQFLELWKDADPGFPEVADARRRLARLEAR